MDHHGPLVLNKNWFIEMFAELHSQRKRNFISDKTQGLSGPNSLQGLAYNRNVFRQSALADKLFKKIIHLVKYLSMLQIHVSPLSVRENRTRLCI